MSRGGFGTALRQIGRAVAKAERERQREVARQHAAQIRAAREAERRAKFDAKEAERQYLLSRAEEADDLSEAVRKRELEIDSVLVLALGRSPAIDPLANLKLYTPARFDEERWRAIEPKHDAYTPYPPGFFARLIPGAARRYRMQVAQGQKIYERDMATFQRKRAARDAAFAAFVASEETRKAEIEQHNANLREDCLALAARGREAVVNHLKLVVARSLGGEADAVSAEVGYAPESKHLVVELELPEFSTIPEEVGFRYVKSGDRIEAIARPLAKRKAMYAHLLSQVALKCIDTVFRGAPVGTVDCLTLNGMLDTIDPATGRELRLCLLSVRVTAESFAALNLRQVQPEQCLRSLKASVSRAPAELLPVRPIVEFDMVDPRFVETLDVMSGLDQRPNLMELTPTEFEGLITNLFSAMGLDTRQTRPSRDGGVDCVAYDPRPIFGGKVVIQAKRYKDTVGVGAVRDLFGTVQNEGASKGILVTTSGFGTAAFEFARGKPLELLDGGHLLHLLGEHAGIDARIVMPNG